MTCKDHHPGTVGISLDTVSCQQSAFVVGIDMAYHAIRFHNTGGLPVSCGDGIGKSHGISNGVLFIKGPGDGVGAVTVDIPVKGACRG